MMFLKLSISDGDGYISTMLDDETSLVCKPVSSTEIIKMVKEYRKNDNFIVNEISPKEEWNISATQTQSRMDSIIRQEQEQMNKSFNKVPDSKSELEFQRYKQDCRKRAFDMAHNELELLMREGKGDLFKIEETADKYYQWLITIPE